MACRWPKRSNTAHKQGILHRDIKPSNLLLDTRGTVWVTDFGLAKADDQQNLTHTGDILGTLRYMPPEAFDGKSDARGDVYSLGLSLYEMLAFRPAFDQKDRGKLISQVTREDPVRLAKLNREIPRDLETIVQKAIDRDPDHRYSTAGAVAADLQRFLDDEPILARQLSVSERSRRWSRKNPVIAGMLVILVAALAGLVGLWLRSERLLAMARREAVGLQLDQAIALCERGDLDRGLLAMAEQLEEYNSMPATVQHAIRANLAAWSPRRITPETLARRILFGDEVPDSQGKLFATVDEDGGIHLWDLATGRTTGPSFEAITAPIEPPPAGFPRLFFSK